MNKYLPFVILFFTAFLVRFAAAVYWEHNVIKSGYISPSTNGAGFYFGDSDTYWQLGKAIAEGKPYNYGGNYIHRMPGYPALLAPLFSIYGNKPPVFAARVENIIFGVLTVFAVVLLAQQIFHNRNVSLLAGFFTAFDPLQIVMNVLVLSETPFCLFMILQLLFFAEGVNRLQKQTAFKFMFFVLSGLMYAAAIYCRPSWLYFVPFAVILAIVLRPLTPRPVPLVPFIIITFTAVLCLCPWWYRNYQITGHFVATTLQTGPSLYDGLSPAATGKSDMSFIDIFQKKLLSEESRAGKDDFPIIGGLTPAALEYEFNKKMQEAAINWAKKNPDKALKLAIRKFFRLWNFFPNEESFSSTTVKVAVFCSFSPVFILGLCGIIGSFRKGIEVHILWFPAMYITLLHIVFVSSIRYRCPAMLGLSILAAWCVVAMFTKRYKNK